jgi:hypothetical protein
VHDFQVASRQLKITLGQVPPYAMESLRSSGFRGLAGICACIRVRLPQARKISQVSSHLKSWKPFPRVNGQWKLGYRGARRASFRFPG